MGRTTVKVIPPGKDFLGKVFPPGGKRFTGLKCQVKVFPGGRLLLTDFSKNIPGEEISGVLFTSTPAERGANPAATAVIQRQVFGTVVWFKDQLFWANIHMGLGLQSTKQELYANR